MRIAGALLLLPALLAACAEEPSFDERYAAAEKKVRHTAAEIDSDLRANDPAATPAPPPAEDNAPAPAPD